MEVKAYSSLGLYCLGFAYQGANTLDLVLDLLFLALTGPQVTPLHTQVDAWRLTESRPAHTQRVRLGDRIYNFLNIHVKHMVVYARGPQVAFGSWAFSKLAS